MAKVEKTEDQVKREQRDQKAKNLGAKAFIEVDDNGITKLLYLKAPHRYTIGLYYNKKERNLMEANEYLLKQCMIEEVSDKEILSPERDDLFYAASVQVDIVLDIIGIKKSKSQIL